jgi:hypothetical protein
MKKMAAASTVIEGYPGTILCEDAFDGLSTSSNGLCSEKGTKNDSSGRVTY